MAQFALFHTIKQTLDRMGPRGLRPVSLPHHRTCGFPHPAVEPSNGQHFLGAASAKVHGRMNPY